MGKERRGGKEKNRREGRVGPIGGRARKGRGMQ